MYIEKVSIDTSTNENVLSLEDVKSERRITNDLQDGRLNRAIESSISFFENQTGFYLRELTFNLNLKTSDQLDRESRSRESYADLYATTPLRYSLNTFTKFEVPIGKVSSGEIVGFDYVNTRNERITLEEDRIDELNASNAILISRSLPLLLSVDLSLLNRSFVELLLYENEDYFTLRGLKTDANPFIENEIKNCLLRIALKLFEYPDDNVMLNDSYVAATIGKYKVNHRI